jgi:hypothetical protein
VRLCALDGGRAGDVPEDDGTTGGEYCAQKRVGGWLGN